MNLLTHTSATTFRCCPQKYNLAYVLGWRKSDSGPALRMGSAVHRVRERMRMRDQYPLRHIEEAPISEHERQATLAIAYAWGEFWSEDDARTDGVGVLATELAFRVPIMGARGGRVRGWKYAGKIDGIIRRKDGSVLIDELKTTSQDIAPSNHFWQRLHIDSQIAGYFWAAMHLGFQPAAVQYDVIRKPDLTIHDVPMLDEDGLKIVHDAGGARVKTQQGKWRQTGDKALGLVMQTRQETPDEHGTRIACTLRHKPENHFARTEVAMTSVQLDEWMQGLYKTKLDICRCAKSGFWPRHDSACNFPPCQYRDICFNRYAGAVPPAGFVTVKNVHPELQEEETHGTKQAVVGPDEGRPVAGGPVAAVEGSSDTPEGRDLAAEYADHGPDAGAAGAEPLRVAQSDTQG